VKTSSPSLTREINIAASPETVYACLTDPGRIVKWFGRRVDADPRIGGRIIVEINDTATMSGEFLELVPNERVAFTFGWEQHHHEVPPGSTTVTFELTPKGDHTTVKFTHAGLPTQELVQKHGEGWDHYFARLETLAGGNDPGPDEFASPDTK
jgi:uncharacterized protein YndB with AHSA1/START domain